MAKFKISKDTVTGDTKEELEADIKSLEAFKTWTDTLPASTRLSKLTNELIAAKKDKLKEMG